MFYLICRSIPNQVKKNISVVIRIYPCKIKEVAFYMELEQLTERIIGCAYTVANTLGNGFLERVYENALAHELKKQYLQVEQQKAIPVYYDQIVVGEYVADLLVEGSVLVELKAAKDIDLQQEITMLYNVQTCEITGVFTITPWR